MIDKIIETGYQLSRIKTTKEGTKSETLLDLEYLLDDFFITMSEVADLERPWDSKMKKTIKEISKEFEKINEKDHISFTYYENLDIVNEIIKNIETIYKEVNRDTFIESLDFEKDVDYIQKHLNIILDVIADKITNALEE